jgi:membrane protein involved in colicin uptake
MTSTKTAHSNTTKLDGIDSASGHGRTGTEVEPAVEAASGTREGGGGGGGGGETMDVIRICVNDVTVDGSRDYETMSEAERAFLDALKKQQRRRSSWCPEQEKKKDDKQEKIRMLSVTGRR